MNKKGVQILSEQMFILFELIVVALITLAFMTYVFSYSAPENFQVKWIANDLALMTESAASSPGIIVYEYLVAKEIKDKFIAFEMQARNSQSTASFYSESKKGFVEVTVLHTFSKLAELSEASTKDKLYFSRYGKMFLASNTTAALNMKELDCNAMMHETTSSRAKKKIMFTGNEDYIGQFQSGIGVNFILGKPEDTDIDIIIDITCGSPSIIINNPSAESQKLACLLASKLA
ncbi:hypothetical protein KY311_05065, partial [Candidatus Woesearchaeota archaeon]|nr:hypothetical protein [Candidatus Woesearchaeota archaeon]